VKKIVFFCKITSFSCITSSSLITCNKYCARHAHNSKEGVYEDTRGL